MKNFLISILCVALSFTITFFCLNQFIRKSTVKKVDTEVQVEESFNNKTETKKSLNIASNNSAYDDIIVDFDTWKKYNKENIDLSTEFIGVDVEGSEISKKSFLEKLKTGNYIPVKLLDADYMYQLYSISDDKEKISRSIKYSSNSTYKYLLKEGKPFPDFNFKDLSGNSFSKEEALGNILVIKCWFIQCKTCVEEFPVINDLYDRYEGHDDVIFLSLAFDKPDKLKKFLSKKEFRYPVVAEQKKFIKDEIGIIRYPAHIIIDKYGDIHKIVNNIDSLILALDNLANGEINLDNELQ